MKTRGKKEFTGEEVLVESQGMQDSNNLEDNEENFLSVSDQKEIDWFLEKKIGNFSGENLDLWDNFVGIFEKTAMSKGWDKYGQETLVELLSSRLNGLARKAFEEWIVEDSKIYRDYKSFKNGLPGRFGTKEMTWKSIVDFHQCKIGKVETINDYCGRYLQASNKITIDELQACKFLFSLSMEVRQLISRYSGEWPRNLEGMIHLAKELVLREESIKFDIGIPTGGTQSAPRKLICFGCQGEGHYVSHCPKRSGNQTEKPKYNLVKSNSINDSINKYSSSVYINANLIGTSGEFQGKALLDSGATDCFVSRKFVESNQIFRHRLKQDRKIQLATGKSAIRIQEETEELFMMIGTHKENIKFLVISDLNEEIILGKSWLDKHNPLIDWPEGIVQFERCDCSLKIMEIIRMKKSEPLELQVSEVEVFQNEQAKENDSSHDELNDYGNISGCCYKNGNNLEYSYPFDDEIYEDNEDDDDILEELDDHNDNDGDDILEELDLNEKIGLMESVVEDESSEFVKTFLNNETKEVVNDIPAQIPEEYRDYAELFSESLADELPPVHTKYQCAIDFKKDAALPKAQKPYPVSFRQREVVEKYINDGLRKGTLRQSKSPIAMPMFLVPKKGGEDRPVVDFRLVNEIVVDNCHPMPCIDDIMSYLAKARIFTKIDLTNAYNLVRIREGDEWKTSFVCHLGQFEYTVMPFGIKTAPAIFQGMMNDVFSDLLGVSVLIYLDDILIFSEDSKTHTEHVREVFRRLKKNRLLAKLKKCVFNVFEVDFLGYVVSTEGVKVAEDKVSAIKDWPKPQKRRELKSFLGTANFNRKFIAGYSDIVAPLLALDSKSVISFKEMWTSKCDEAFEKLKLAMSSAPVLRHVDFELPFLVETDASDYALGAVLLQPETLDSTIFRPVAYASRKLTKPERNYSAYDKELLGIIFAFGKWHQFLYGAIYPIKVLTDHSNLQYFRQRHLLSNRHVNWKLFLQNYEFKLSYRPGSANVVADALSRRADFVGEVNGTSGTSLREKVSDMILPNEYWEEKAEMSTLKQIRNEDKRFVESEVERQEIIQKRHDSLIAGHFGQQRTYELIKRDFYWPKMLMDIQKYITSCSICQKIKPSRKKPNGKLMPLPIATGPWKSIAMDFIVKLPVSNGFDSILVIVDRFSKMSHLIACKESIDAETFAELFLKSVVKYHGLPKDIVTDRGTLFTSRFWRSLCKKLDIETKLSTSAHPQTDGQSERTNQTLEQYLRAFVNYKQDNWSELLHFAEIAMNNAVNSSTKRSPFEINLGYHPDFDGLGNDEKTQVPSLDMFTEKMKNIWTETISNLKDTAKRMKKNSENLRVEMKLNVGDLVWLDTEHLRRKRPSRKLDFKRIGPFKIVEKINDNAYRLKLPEGSLLHDVFNVSKLSPYKNSGTSGNEFELEPDVIEGFQEFEVEDILDFKVVNNVNSYLVKWKGYSELHNSWEPETNLTNCDEILGEFKKSRKFNV